METKKQQREIMDFPDSSRKEFSNLQTLYHEVLWNYVHSWSLSTVDVVSILPSLEIGGVISSKERRMIEARHTPLGKIEAFFKEIMPMKQLKYHHALIDILKIRNQSGLAKLLASKIDQLNESPQKSSVTHRSASSSEGYETSPISMEPSDFTDQKYVGQGTYAKVYEATYRKTRQRVAIKKLLASEDSWKNEVETLRRANHPNIVSIIGVVENLDVEEVWIVTEAMNSGSLRPYCTGSKRLELTSVQKLSVSRQCWSALSYLHDRAKITHKDIKPENILLHRKLDGELTAKLCDFGLAEIKNRLTITEETRLGGTVMYYPPEFAESKRNPRKADVYSLGATLCELFTHLHFWHDPASHHRLEDCQILYKLVTVFQCVSAGNVSMERFGPGADALDKCASCPVPIRDILKRTVYFYRQDRPSTSEVLSIFEEATTEPLPIKRQKWSTSSMSRWYLPEKENDQSMLDFQL